jgi:LysM repeat protein
MKLKLPSISKLPTMRIPKFQFPKRPVKRFNAAARRAAPTLDDMDDDSEPQAKLSTAFVIMLLVHVVAVVGVYAFNSIKANRRTVEAPTAAASRTPARKSAPAPDERAAASAGATSSSHASPQVMTVAGTRVHPVRPGDSLARIAGLYSVSIADLAELNQIKESAILRPGQVLNIPATKVAMTTAPSRSLSEARKEKPEAAAKKTEEPTKSAPAKSAATAPKTYTVAKGDNPHAIARKFGVSHDELLKVNKISDEKRLQIGTVLKIPSK